MKRRAALGGAAALVLAATVTSISIAPASASTWGTVSATRTKPWGTNPKKQPKPQPWYHTVFSDEFTSPTAATDPNLQACESPGSVNAPLSATDWSNGLLQKPTLKADVSITKAGHDNKALQVATQAGSYNINPDPTTPPVYANGMTNGRVSIGPDFSLANHIVSIRLRAVGGPGAGQVGKSATMIWPTTGWPWEFDLAETSPGNPGVSAYHHIESQPGKGDTVSNFLYGTTSFDPYAWHTYTIEFLGGALVTGVEYLVDGQPVTFKSWDTSLAPMTTITGAWIPSSGTGHIAIGKALPAGTKGAPYATRGDVPSNYFDAVQVDWVKILAHDSTTPAPTLPCNPATSS